MTATRCYLDQELPSDLGILASLYPILNRWATAGGLEMENRVRTTVAVTEAITNAIIHAHKDKPEARIYLRLVLENGRLIAEVGDRGQWPWEAPPPPGPDRWEQTGGRGLVIIKELAARFELLPREGGGTLARMTFEANNNGFLTGKDAGQGLLEPGKGGTEMDYREEIVNDVDIMRVTGRIDLVTSNTLKDAIRERLHRQRLTLVLNLERVDFINSSGLGALVSILKDVRLVNGRMALCNLAPYVQEIFDITQLSNVFEIFPEEKEAVRTLASHAATVANA